MEELKGYYGKMLRVNLHTKESQTVDLDQIDIEQFLGGRALGAALLYREVGQNVEPLSADNKLIFTTGPLVGTRAPSSARFVVTTKSPLTGLYLFSICSGMFGPGIKKAGYDGIIVEGKSETPVVLVISSESVEFLPAGDLWGTTTDVCEERLVKQYQGKHPQVVTIGPGGENLVKMACIISKGRAAGRGGPGAVMGSKNLKAIVTMGDKQVELYDPELVNQMVEEAKERVNNVPFLKQGMGKFGSAISLGITAAHGVLPTNNWQNGTFKEVDGIRPETLRNNFLLRDSACPTCVIGCSKIVKVNEGLYRGAQTDGPEYETVYAFGSNCGNSDLAAIINADQLCDKYGIDTISAGVTIGFAMECFERGLINQTDADGLDLRFGNHQVFEPLIKKMTYREGIGGLLADGVRDAAEKIGGSSEEFAMHAKGMELGGYDPRGIKAQSLVFACGSRGGCHHGGGYVIAEELVSGKWDRFAVEGKGKMVQRARDFRMIMDSVTYCAFMGMACGHDWTAKIVSAVTGMELIPDDLTIIGERASNLERMYNVREGLRRKDDTLPPRLLKESLPEAPGAGPALGPDFDTLIDDFYSVCGWDLVTGIPVKETIDKFNLTRFSFDAS